VALIHSGRQLKQLAAERKKVTTTQTAAQAVRAIINKFGNIKDNIKYYHRGNGIWSMYIISEDRKKTGKIAKNVKQWKAEPWRYDLKKIDTKEGLVKAPGKSKLKTNKAGKVSQKSIFAKF
jgi:hypothetical protein